MSPDQTTKTTVQEWIMWLLDFPPTERFVRYLRRFPRLGDPDWIDGRPGLPDDIIRSRSILPGLVAAIVCGVVVAVSSAALAIAAMRLIDNAR